MIAPKGCQDWRVRVMKAVLAVRKKASRWHVGGASREPWGLFAVVFLFTVSSTAGPVPAEESDLYFTILHTNDEHSAILPSPLVDYLPELPDPTVGGFARLSRLVHDIRAAKTAANEPVMLLSAGDILGGGPHFWLIPGGETPEVSIMQRIGYDAITIGNHDFDYGPEILAQYYRAAGYPGAQVTPALVASNLRIPPDHPLAACGIQSTHLIELPNGLRVGYFGLLGKNAAKLASGMTPIDISDPKTAAAAAVSKLQAMGANVIIGLTHAGRYEDEELAAAVPGIDVLITGHFHPMTLETPVRIGDTILAQSSAFLGHLGVLELAYCPKQDRLRLRNSETGQAYLVPIDDSIEEDTAISELITGYTEKLSQLVGRLTNGKVTNIKTPVLSSDFGLDGTKSFVESNLGDFVTDAMRLGVEASTGERVDFAIQANGVIRGDVPSGRTSTSRGQICFYDLVSAIGLGTGRDGNPGYPLVSIYLTGNEIYRVLELTLFLARYADVFFLQISGGRFTYDPAWVDLFRIPFTRFSVPTFRAVVSVDRFIGRGAQADSDGSYRPISRGDDTLYHVVCDAYILSFFPKVAALLPFYKVVPKGREGKEITPGDAILQRDGREFKFWHAVVEYALAQPPGQNGIPVLPSYYERTGMRIIPKSTYLPYVWLIPCLPLLVMICYAFVWSIRRRRCRRKT